MTFIYIVIIYLAIGLATNGYMYNVEGERGTIGEQLEYIICWLPPLIIAGIAIFIALFCYGVVAIINPRRE